MVQVVAFIMMSKVCCKEYNSDVWFDSSGYPSSFSEGVQRIGLISVGSFRVWIDMRGCPFVSILEGFLWVDIFW